MRVRFGYTAPDAVSRDVLLRIDTLTDADRQDLSPYWMTRVGDDRYELDVELDDDWTVLYQFHVSRGRRTEIDAHAGRDRNLWRAVLDECIPDPANPAQVPDAHGRAPSSVFDPTGLTAACAVWPPVRVANTLVTATVPVSHGRRRRVWTHAAERPTALLLLFDGDVWTGAWPITALLDAEVAAGRLPPLAIVLVDAGDQEQRSADLSASDDFADDVAAITRWAAAAVGRTFTPDRVVACGQSLGGLAAAHAALRHPGVIGNVLSQSGSFWYPDPASLGPDGDVQRDVRRWSRRPVRFHLQVGAMERYLLGPNHGLFEALIERGYDAALDVFGGGHGHPWWYLTMPAGLAELLGEPGAQA